MDNNNNNNNKQNKPADSITNQNHAIQYSSKFTVADTSKPVPLAHFMGARRDLKGPVLTKKRVDEKEIRPDGWEIAEKNFQQAQSNPGLSSLASLLSGPGASRSNLSSHAGNLSKRALPGMVPQDRINNSQQEKKQQRETFKQSSSSKSDNDQPKNPSAPQSSTSHADSYLKPKSLADRLALLGVSNDLQSVKTNVPTTAAYPVVPSPRTDKFPIDQSNKPPPQAHESAQGDLTKKFNRITKSKSVILNTTSQQDSSEEKPDRNEQRPLSIHIAPPRALPPTPNPQAKVPSPSYSQQPREPLNARPKGISQPTTDPSSKRNTRPQSAFPHAPHISTESTGATLGVPNKALTASLSRLAGSNIVAQRLEWSKQKEQLGTMDEFGSPLLKSSPNSTSSALNSQIPSPVLPSQSINQFPVLSEHSKNSSETPIEPASRASSQTRLHSVQTENTGPKQTEPDSMKKQLNQYNKSTRSDEDDDQRLGINKRNKKNVDQLRNSSPDKKENENHEARATGATAADIQSNVTSPSRLSHKNRPPRTPRRPSASSPTKWRTEASKLCSSPVGTIVSRQLPSIPTFSPLMKKGTSELAAVWGPQLSNSTKKVAQTDSLPKKPSQPLSSPLSAHRPLPTPPPPATLTPARPKTATATDSRPLPVPPSVVTATNPLSPEPRSRTRPLPTPQIKSESTTLPNPVNDRQANPRSPIDASKIWASYEEKQQSFSALGQAEKIVQLEIFQLNRNQTDELSTTMLDTDDYGTFYSQETLLIICTLKGSRMVLMVWRGRDVGEEDEGETEGRIGRLLKKYGIDGQAQLVIVHQGYEPPELVQALGGRLLLRTGDRFDSVYQRSLSAVFTCKSFPLLPRPSSLLPRSISKRVVVIEELFLNHPASSTTLCTGYASLIKICTQQPTKLNMFLWKGRASDHVEVEECKILANQVRNEFGASKADVEMVDEGNESKRFLSLLGDVKYACSYHWRYKALVPMSGMVMDSQGKIISRVSETDVSIVWTGLELFVLVPSSSRPSSSTSTSRVHNLRKALQVAQSLGSSHPPPFLPHPPLHNRLLAVHCLLFPSIIPIDLRTSIRFSADLDRLNEGSPNPQSMNLFSFDESMNNPTFSDIL